MYLVRAGRPKLWGQPHSRPWALDAPRGAKPRRSTPQVPEAGVFPSPPPSPGLLEQPPWPWGTWRLALPSPPHPCTALPLAASRAVGREELWTVRTKAGRCPALLARRGSVCIPWCSLSAADVLPLLGAGARVHVCACLSDVYCVLASILKIVLYREMRQGWEGRGRPPRPPHGGVSGVGARGPQRVWPGPGPTLGLARKGFQ